MYRSGPGCDRPDPDPESAQAGSGRSTYGSIHDPQWPSALSGHDVRSQVPLHIATRPGRGAEMDESRRQWHQSWVTNRGGLGLLDGGLDNGHMVLTGTERKPVGASSLRGVWWSEGTNVHEKAERSTDGGRFGRRYSTSCSAPPETTRS